MPSLLYNCFNNPLLERRVFRVTLSLRVSLTLQNLSVNASSCSPALYIRGPWCSPDDGLINGNQLACVIDVYLLSADIKEQVKQIEKAVSGKEPRFVLRALRALPSTSRRLNPNVLHKAVSGFYTSNAVGKEFLLSFLEEVPHTHCILYNNV